METRWPWRQSADNYGVWTPDGLRILFSSTRDGTRNIYWRAADVTGQAERLTTSPNEQYPHSITPDGSRVIFREHAPETRRDIHMLTLDAERRTTPLIVEEYHQESAEISPDGRWLAYQANAGGEADVYVRPFPDVDAGRSQVSTSGGTQPLWSRDGRALFYRTRAGVMEVPVDTGDTFETGTPVLVVEGAYFSAGALGRTYDISPDGERFLMITDGTAEDEFGRLMRINVVLNWFEELKTRAPTAR